MEKDFDYITYTWIHGSARNALNDSYPRDAALKEISIKEENFHSEFIDSDRRLDNYHLHYSSKL